MGRRVIALLAVGIALVAASARAQSGQVVLAPTVYASHDLPANAITTFGVTCPAGYVAASAGVSRPAPGVSLLAIAPVGFRGYRFRFGNPVTNGDQRVTVGLACRRIRGARGSTAFVLRLRSLRPKLLVVPARKTTAATLSCPDGTTPAGAGFDLGPARQQSLTAFRVPPGLSVRRQTQTLSRLTFSVLNAGTVARAVALRGSCLTLLRAAGAPAEQLHVRVTTSGVAVRPGGQTYRRTCPRGWFSLGAGFSLLARSTSADAAAAVGNGGRWTIASDAGAGERADLQLTCGRLGP